ncbi:MAG: C25 family cysteine peptidase, partial [Pyrinomonadaceae bacterium]
MKRIIAASILVFVVSQLSNISGQKLNKTPDKTSQQITAQEIKTSISPLITDAGAFSDGNGVLLKWQTGAESDVVGFNIYRINGNEKIRINEHLIVSALIRKGEISKFGNDYNFFDEKGNFQNSYIIETVYFNGKNNLLNAISPRFTSDLRNVFSLSSESLQQSKAVSQPVIETSKFALPGKSNNQITKDPVGQKWVAAQPGVKIAISKQGFYRVSRAELQAAGFDVNSNSANWQLYYNGIQQSIIVEETGQYIEFYATNFEDTRESGKQAYFLIAGSTQGKRINSKVGRRISASVQSTNFFQTQSKKERLTYFPSIRNGDNQNFFGTFLSSTPATVNFTLKGVDQSVPTADITVVLQGGNLFPHQTRISVNGQEIGTVSGANHDSMIFNSSIPTSLLNEGTNSLRFVTFGSTNDISLFDSVSVNLARRYIADGNQLAFYTKNYKASKIEGFTSPNIRVFETTYEGNLELNTNLPITENSGLYSVEIPSNRAKSFFAVADNAVKQADSVSQNSPSTLSTPAHDGRLVIISHKNWLTQANAWADYRRADGFTVEVVDVEDIYDEFNFGVLSAKSLTDFLQYAKLNWQIPPSYVLLMGDGTFDPRNFTGSGDFNFMPVKLVDTTYTETGSDDAISDFNNDGLAEIPIGRLPVRSGAEVAHILGKVTTFEQTVAQAFNRGALCASDQPDGFDFAALCSRIVDELPASVNKTHVNRLDPDAHTVLLNNLNSGKYLVNYSGHG